MRRPAPSPSRLLLALAALAGWLALRDARAMTLGEAQERARAANLGLIAERARVPIAAAERLREGAWPGLDLAFEAARETPHESLTASVPLDVGPRRTRRLAAFQAAVATADATLASSVQTLRIEVRRAYFALVAAQRKNTVLDSLSTLAQRAAAAADERFARGEAPRLEAVQSRLAATQAAAERRGGEGAERAAATELASLLGLPADTPFSPLDDLASGPTATVEESIRQALAANAELALLDRRAQETQAKLELARALRAPALSLQGAATFNAQPEFRRGWRAGVTLILPSPGSGRTAIEVEQRTLEQIRAERAAKVATLSLAVAAATERVTALREQLNAYRSEILPQAEEVEGMATESYQTGQSDLAALLVALQTGRETRLRAIQTGLDLQNARADLEAAMGVPLP